MRHDFALRGFAFGLRPVETDDAAFIVQMRSDPDRSRFINRGARNTDAQRQWLEAYFERPDDYFFVVQRLSDDAPQGLLGLYNFGAGRKSAEWGRWVLSQNSLAAVECALLIYRFAFDMLGLDEVFCRTIAENGQVIAFHDSCGLSRVAEVMIDLDGAPKLAVEHGLTAVQWVAVQSKLAPVARRGAARAGRH